MIADTEKPRRNLRLPNAEKKCRMSPDAGPRSARRICALSAGRLVGPSVVRILHPEIIRVPEKPLTGFAGPTWTMR